MCDYIKNVIANEVKQSRKIATLLSVARKDRVLSSMESRITGGNDADF